MMELKPVDDTSQCLVRSVVAAAGGPGAPAATALTDIVLVPATVAVKDVISKGV